MAHFAGIAEHGREAILKGDTARLSELIDENFNTRRAIYNLPPWQIGQVEIARRCGASAKFAGSGGAIVGTYADEGMFENVRANLGLAGSKTIRPIIS